MNETTQQEKNNSTRQQERNNSTRQQERNNSTLHCRRPPATTCNHLQPPAPPLQQNRFFLPTRDAGFAGVDVTLLELSMLEL
ncbi:hypothetical protein TNCV_2750581 [Trichonephila clavipes]|nr:hypothetical protein TNCV_2750581 [Trichonephila clavipes]